MSEEISLQEYKKAYREVVKEETKRGFLIHLVAYAGVNAMLITFNLISAPRDLWFFWPLFGWGIGLTIHYLVAVRWIDRKLKEREAKAEYRVRESKSK